MKKQDLIAEVTLFPSEEGRKGPLPEKRFSCRIKVKSSFFDLRIILTEIKNFAPGSTAKVPVKFLDPENAMANINIGEVYELWELKPIGTLKIIKIME